MSRKSIEELEKEVEEILNKAEEKRLKIISDARKKAEEILKKPFPIDEYEKEAQKIIDQAKQEAERILREAEEKAESIKKIDENKLREIVHRLVKIITGVE
ncbi:MAG: hypothetical protein ABWW65_03125 [Thermoprotei archaeon]